MASVVEKVDTYVSQKETSSLEPDHVADVGRLANEEDHQEGPIECMKKHPRAVLWCVYAIWVILLTSFDNQASGIVLGVPEFRKDFGSPYEGDYVLPAEWQSAYSGGPVATAVVGSLGTGYVCDLIGRKFTFALAFVLAFIAITIELISTTNQVFFAGKLIAGLASGTFLSVCVTYIGEISPLALRGVLTAASAIAFTLGPFIVALIVNTTGTMQSRWAYRAVFVSQYGFTGIGAVILPFIPESPWWLINNGKTEKAARALKRVGYSQEEVQKRLAVIANTLEQVRNETAGVTYLECFRKSNLRRTIVSIMPLSIQALSGVFFVAAYSTYYQQLAGYSASESFKLGIVQQVLSMIGNITSWFLIDRVGRRNLTFYGLIILTILLFVTGGLAVIATPGAIKGTVALLLIYCYLYNVTIGATAYSLLTEVATARLRVKTAAIGLALQNSLFTMWGFVIPYLFNPNHLNLGAKISFIFGGLAVLSIIYMWFYQPETAGRSYEELDEMFMKRIPARQFKTYKTEAETRGQQVHAEYRRASNVTAI